jgi:hypothetical protein
MPVQMGPILVQLQEAMASNQYSADTCTAGSSSHDQRTPGLFASYSHHTTRCARGGRDGLAASLAGWAATGGSERAALAGPLLAPDSGGSQDSVGVVGLSVTKSEGGKPTGRVPTGKPTASDAWHSLRRQHLGCRAWPKCRWLAADLCSGPGLGSVRDERKLDLDCFDARSAHPPPVSAAASPRLRDVEASRLHSHRMRMASTWTA